MEVRLDRGDLMSYIKWCDVLNCGCDITCIAYDVIHIVAVISYIHWFDKIDPICVMTQILWE